MNEQLEIDFNKPVNIFHYIPQFGQQDFSTTKVKERRSILVKATHDLINDFICIPYHPWKGHIYTVMAIDDTKFESMPEYYKLIIKRLK